MQWGFFLFSPGVAVAHLAILKGAPGLLCHSASTGNSQQGFLRTLSLRLIVCNPWLDMHHAQRARHLPLSLLTVANPARNSLPPAVRQSLRGSTNAAQEQKPATSSARSTQDGAEEPPLCPVAQEVALGVKPYLPVLCFSSPNKAGDSWEDCKCTYAPMSEITLKNDSWMFKNGYYSSYASSPDRPREQHCCLSVSWVGGSGPQHHLPFASFLLRRLPLLPQQLRDVDLDDPICWAAHTLFGYIFSFFWKIPPIIKKRQPFLKTDFSKN